MFSLDKIRDDKKVGMLYSFNLGVFLILLLFLFPYIGFSSDSDAKFRSIEMSNKLNENIFVFLKSVLPEKSYLVTTNVILGEEIKEEVKSKEKETQKKDFVSVVEPSLPGFISEQGLPISDSSSTDKIVSVVNKSYFIEKTKVRILLDREIYSEKNKLVKKLLKIYLPTLNYGKVSLKVVHADLLIKPWYKNSTFIKSMVPHFLWILAIIISIFIILKNYKTLFSKMDKEKIQDIHSNYSDEKIPQASKQVKDTNTLKHSNQDPLKTIVDLIEKNDKASSYFLSILPNAEKILLVGSYSSPPMRIFMSNILKINFDSAKFSKQEASEKDLIRIASELRQFIKVEEILGEQPFSFLRFESKEDISTILERLELNEAIEVCRYLGFTRVSLYFNKLEDFKKELFVAQLKDGDLFTKSTVALEEKARNILDEISNNKRPVSVDHILTDLFESEDLDLSTLEKIVDWNDDFFSQYRTCLIRFSDLFALENNLLNEILLKVDNKSIALAASTLNSEQQSALFSALPDNREHLVQGNLSALSEVDKESVVVAQRKILEIYRSMHSNQLKEVT